MQKSHPLGVAFHSRHLLCWVVCITSSPRASVFLTSRSGNSVTETSPGNLTIQARWCTSLATLLQPLAQQATSRHLKNSDKHAITGSQHSLVCVCAKLGLAALPAQEKFICSGCNLANLPKRNFCPRRPVPMPARRGQETAMPTAPDTDPFRYPFSLLSLARNTNVQD